MTADRIAALEAAQRIVDAGPINMQLGDAIMVARALLSTAKEADRMREALVKAEVALCAAEIVIDADDCVETFNLIQGTRRAAQAALLPSEGTKT